MPLPPPHPALPIIHWCKSDLGLNKVSLTRIEGLKSSVGSEGSFMSWCLKNQNTEEKFTVVTF